MLRIQKKLTEGFETEVDGKVVKLQMWDTAGQETYRSIINSYYRCTCGTILTYNITNLRSFNNLDRWIYDINQYNNCKHNYSHPIFDKNAVYAQKFISNKNNKNIWFCGAYLGYGFHEDGIKSGLEVAEKIIKSKRPW